MLSNKRPPASPVKSQRVIYLLQNGVCDILDVLQGFNCVIELNRVNLTLLTHKTSSVWFCHKWWSNDIKFFTFRLYNVPVSTQNYKSHTVATQTFISMGLSLLEQDPKHLIFARVWVWVRTAGGKSGSLNVSVNHKFIYVQFCMCVGEWRRGHVYIYEIFHLFHLSLRSCICEIWDGCSFRFLYSFDSFSFSFSISLTYTQTHTLLVCRPDFKCMAFL